ncbi:MAG: DUF3854 domain-containing protein, partial [Actinomycetota bacterium]|nr:DUF3854 domain-containing protein [Actinomycetota bacterium]
TPGGEIRYQLRHDVPRLALDNKRRLREVRYDTPAGTDICIDVHPAMHHLLSDVSVPLSVCEGVKKGDSLASRDRLAVSLTGVWNWGRKREVGGAKYGRPELLSDWDDIPLKGRRVNLVFDAD